MRLSRRKKQENFSIDLTTCSDIIFTLLIFYILTQNFVTRFAVDLPKIQSKEQTSPHQIQRIEITEMGEINWNDVKITQNWKAGMSAKLKTLATNTPFLVLAHKKAPAGTAIEILDHLRIHGINRVAFAGIADSVSIQNDSPKE